MYRSFRGPVQGFLGETPEEARARFDAMAAADTARELNIARDAFGLPPVGVVDTMNGKPVVLPPVVIASRKPPTWILIAGLIGAYFLVSGKAGRGRYGF